MAFDRPTLPEIAERVASDFKSRLSLVSAPLRRSVVLVMSRVVAGAAHMLHGHLEYLSKQLFPDTSDDEYLVRQAGLYNITKTAATFATGTVSVTSDVGAGPIPADAILRRTDGAEYTVDAEVLVDVGGNFDVAVTAVEAGEDGNADSGVVLTFESPIGGVDSAATVTAQGLTGGADEESTEALRTQLLQRLRNPPEGGAAADYEAWALEVDGVTRVWVYPLADGAGTVTVRFMRDNDFGSPFPSVGEVSTLQDYLDTKRPVTAEVTVLAPVEKTWAFTISLSPDTSAGRAAVEAELEDLFRTDGEPGGTIPIEDVRTAIGVGARSQGATYTLTTPSADLTHAAGELPTVGTITWS